MGADGRLPSGDPRVRAEVVHESERTRVTRLFLGGGTVVRKEPLGPGSDRRLRHELAILERLRGVPGIAQVLDDPRYPGSVVLADAGGSSLAGLAKPMAVDDLILLAVDLARAVAAMHGAGVMHRDITPTNIVLAGDGAPCLVDFALAMVVAEIRPEFTHHAEIVGTLAYLAPEQTGRTARSVDQRADLYAFGATLYELAVGAPPFGSGDGAAGAREPGRAGAPLRDRHAPAAEGAGQPLPDRRGCAPRPEAAAGCADGSGSGSAPHR
jgi:serine/threonine protein kinase